MRYKVMLDGVPRIGSADYDFDLSSWKMSDELKAELTRRILSSPNTQALEVLYSARPGFAFQFFPESMLPLESIAGYYNTSQKYCAQLLAKNCLTSKAKPTEIAHTSMEELREIYPEILFLPTSTESRTDYSYDGFLFSANGKPFNRVKFNLYTPRVVLAFAMALSGLTRSDNEDVLVAIKNSPYAFATERDVSVMAQVEPEPADDPLETVCEPVEPMEVMMEAPPPAEFITQTIPIRVSPPPDSVELPAVSQIPYVGISKDLFEHLVTVCVKQTIAELGLTK